MKDFEAVAQPAKNRDGVLHIGFVDQNGLEPALQRGVVLDVFAVLVQGGGADHVQLAAGQHRLEHVAGVQGTFRRPGADNGVQLVDKQQDSTLARLHLRKDRLQPFLELAAVFRTGHQGTHVEGEDRLVPQALRDIGAHDPLGQPLDDRRLAHAGVTDQNRVVLGLSAQDLDHPTDLGVPADHRIKIDGAGLGDQVTAVFLQRLVGALRRGGSDPLVAAHLGQRAQERITCHAIIGQYPPGRRWPCPPRRGRSPDAPPTRIRP